MASRTGDELRQLFLGVLLGTAVGDSLGLPAEGMSPGRIARLWRGQWRQRFLFGFGMVSDDTEHSLFVAQALLAHPDNADAFQRCLAWKLRLWLLGLPAGIGFATLRAILKLWVGAPPMRSGVRSAGNGPAMRSAIIGAYFAADAATRRRFVEASTRLTHTDPRAETAALAIAEAAALCVNPAVPRAEWLAHLTSFGDDAEWQQICRSLTGACSRGASVKAFAESLELNNGVTGYAYHSVPVALYAWLRHSDDFRVALESVLDCGGDTDTVGAMVGALCGASTGGRNIPPDWLDSLRDWPRSQSLLKKVASRLAVKMTANGTGPVHYFWPGLILRNAIFLATVLVHGLRRLFPPY